MSSSSSSSSSNNNSSNSNSNDMLGLHTDKSIMSLMARVKQVLSDSITRTNSSHNRTALGRLPTGRGLQAPMRRQDETIHPQCPTR
jgi:hypothetical protein